MEDDSNMEVNSFLQTEFFFYLLPCYYGLIALIWRYFKIIEIQPTFYVKRITGEWLFKYFESEEQKNRNSDSLTYKVLPASYVIKSKLSLYNSYLYLCMIFLSFVSTSSMFYSANHKLQSFLYFFGFLAWYFATIVLRRELQRNMSQSIWIHRLFWILAGTFSVYKMFQDYFLPLNLIFNILFIISNLILAIYGIYRPQDSDTLEMSVGSDDIPSFIKILFQTIELNEYVRSFLKIQDPINQNVTFAQDIINVDIDQADLVQIGKTFKHSADTIKKQINLLNQLPRRNVFVDKKIRYVRFGDKFKSCYFILTQIGNNRFQSERTIQEFKQLYTTLSQTFTPQNFPKHSLPKLTVMYSNDQQQNGQNFVISDHSNKSDVIQKWLDDIFKIPIFITADLLKFLKVGQEQSAPFLTYFQNSFKMFCSPHYILLLHNRQKKQEKQAASKSSIKELVGYYNKQITTKEETDNQILLSRITNKLQFVVAVNPDSKDDDHFQFILVCTIDKKTRMSWGLNKIEDNILSLNQRIEQDCNCSVPFFYNMIGTKRKNYKAKQQAYRAYLQLLLKNTKYYCTSLFFFVRFDPIKLEINTTGNQICFAVEKPEERKSRYLSEYQDKGLLIQVLRIDRVQKSQNGEDILKLKLRRNQVCLSNKTTVQLQALRKKLVQIYKGVSFIPELSFKDCRKIQAKDKIEAFLLKIQNLPKIEINRDYLSFYQNSINRQIQV